jgi:tRNA C32,U32 (ribose-2'-O)-methylase TrmJ
MTDTRLDAERRADTASKDLELVVSALQEALSVIDDHDPDRNPARCMRQLRRLFDNVSLRAAMRRLVGELPPPPESRRR